MAKGATLSEAGSREREGSRVPGGSQRLLQQAATHRSRLLAIARRVLAPGDTQEAEDVVQEVYARLASATAPASLPAWLSAVTFRCALDLKRRRARRAEPGDVRGALSPELSPDDAAAQAELARAAQRALNELPEPYRQALALRFCEGRSFAEIAEQMKSVERTTRTWVGRGLVRLRAALVEGGSL
jgi:RNA polymerase sigma factor (sigma-70 family)